MEFRRDSADASGGDEATAIVLAGTIINRRPQFCGEEDGASVKRQMGSVSPPKASFGNVERIERVKMPLESAQ
jgi:hypothetical protein